MTLVSASTAAERRVGPWVLVATSLLVLLVFINQTSLNVALPALARDLDAGAREASWFVLGYMLPMTSLVLVYGRLTDLVGRRRLYLAGIVVFLAATVLCALAASALVLVVARVLQGVGAAALTTNTTAILTDVYPVDRLGVVLGLNASVAAVGQTVGPLVGGALVGLLGWRGIFGLEVVLGLVGLAAAWRLVPRDRRRARERAGEPETLDRWGALLSVGATALLVLWLNDAPERGWGSSWTLAMALLTLAAGAAFVWSQTRARHPLLDLRVLAEPGIAQAYAGAFLSSVSHFAVVLLVSLHLQNVAGFSPLGAGAVVAAASAGTMVAAALAGRLVPRVPLRTLTGGGMALVALGAGALVPLTGHAPATVPVAVALAVMGVGVGLFMTPNTTTLMQRVSRARVGIANALRTTLQQAGYLVSTGLGLGLATAWLPNERRQAAYDGVLTATDADDLLLGLRVAFAVLAGLAVVGVVVSTLPTRPPTARPPARPEDRP